MLILAFSVVFPAKGNSSCCHIIVGNISKTSTETAVVQHKAKKNTILAPFPFISIPGKAGYTNCTVVLGLG